MELKIVLGDIFSVSCDAYVNPTDLQLSGSGGLDREFHKRAGAAWKTECAVLREKITPGGTVVSSGGELPVKYVLHTACPNRSDDTEDYRQLAQCYRGILQAAASKREIRHLALPLVGTGSAGYSLGAPCYAESEHSLAAVTILSTLMQFNRTHTLTVVCSSQEKYDSLQKTLRWIRGRNVGKRSRIRGSLLGGAAGDALGYPVEFNGAENSRVREYELHPATGTALISDDTQMTLFTACGLLWGYSRSCMKGIGGDIWSYIKYAYLDWLKTQYPGWETKMPISWIRNIPELISRRAPGMTCLSALQEGGGSIKEPINNSKGCGGVMRIAPVALYSGAHRHWNQEYCLESCAEAAAITHGHPLGWLSAAALGNILYDIMLNFSMQYAVLDTVRLLRKQYAQYPETEVMVGLLQKAMALAEKAGESQEIDLITQFDITAQLGQGWVGEEALAVGLFCALVGEKRGFDLCLWNAVGHKGDSDSTGSIAGQIWGAYFGEEAIEKKWLTKLELRSVIEEIADDLTEDCKMSEYGSYWDHAWVRKYLSGEGATHIPGAGEVPAGRCIQVPWSETSIDSYTVDKYDLQGQKTGWYRVLFEEDSILHVAPTEADAKTGAPGFGIVTIKYDEKKKAYTEKHGWVKKHTGDTVEFWYNNNRYILLLNHVEKTLEIFDATAVRAWVGSLQRRFDEWGDPLEFRIPDPKASLPVAPISIIAMGSNYLRDFFL